MSILGCGYFAHNEGDLCEMRKKKKRERKKEGKKERKEKNERRKRKKNKNCTFATELLFLTRFCQLYESFW